MRKSNNDTLTLSLLGGGGLNNKTVCLKDNNKYDVKSLRYYTIFIVVFCCD